VTGGKPWIWRWLILRRVVQLSILLAFYATLHQGWTMAGSPVLRGNLSASELLGLVPLADPFAVAQLLLAGGSIGSRALIGAAIVLVFYLLVGGRVFCSWVCPVNPVADLAGWLRRKLDLQASLRLPRTTRLWAMGLALALSPLLGTAAFEWISPIGMLQRGLLFGMGLGWIAIAALFVFDLFVVKHGWCGHLCPVGAFYGLLGRAAQVRVAFDQASCTQCGECAVVCPEPHVLNLKRAAEAGMVASGDCTNCGRCTPVCPEGSLRFDWRVRIQSRGRA